MSDNKPKKLLLIILFSFYIIEKIKFISGNKNIAINEPKISVIIPIYNGGKYLNYSLKSIQNQIFKELEIIIIDDNSKDNSLEIIQKYMKNDKRIRLIKNIVNRKILFCKSIGALNSKGKYIIEVDQDDMITRDDALSILYNDSEKLKLDLLHFKHFRGRNITHFINYPKKDIQEDYKNIEIQPELKTNQFKKHIYLLWGNLIKTDLYKKVIYNLWPIIINYKIIFQEDFLITFFILIFAQKSKNTENKFYLNLKNKNQISNRHLKNPEFYLSVIFAGIIFYEYYIKSYPQDFQILFNYIFSLRKKFKIAKKLFPNLFKYFFGKILSNNRLFNLNKTKIMNMFNISENCALYKCLNKNQRALLFNNFSEKKPNLYRQKKEFYKVSIIIIYLNYKKIVRTINMINIQNLDILEIIIVYDEENEVDYNLLNNYIKSFSFIRLIYNKIKRGTLYSISKAVMQTKGDYLIILNPNSFFLDGNSLKNIYNEIKKNDLDILEFNLYIILTNNYLNLYKCKHFKSDFNLNKIKYNLDYNNIDINKDLLTNKIFRTKYFKKIIINYNLYKIKEIIDYYYNDIFAFIFENHLHKFKRISSESIFINDIDFEKPKFNNFTSGESKKMNEAIFYINFIFDNSKKEKIIKEKILKEFFNVLSIIFNKFSKISKNSVKLINKFIESHFISRDNKILLKFYYNSLVN